MVASSQRGARAQDNTQGRAERRRIDKLTDQTEALRDALDDARKAQWLAGLNA